MGWRGTDDDARLAFLGTAKFGGLAAEIEDANLHFLHSLDCTFAINCRPDLGSGLWRKYLSVHWFRTSMALDYAVEEITIR